LCQILNIHITPSHLEMVFVTPLKLNKLSPLLFAYLVNGRNWFMYFLVVTFATVWACFLPSVGNNKTINHARDEVFSKAAIRDPGISKYSSTDKTETQNVSIFEWYLQTLSSRQSGTVFVRKQPLYFRLRRVSRF